MNDGQISRQARARGASGLTYGILVGLVAVVAITSITRSGAATNALFGAVSNSLLQVRPVTMATPAAPGLYAFTSHTFTTCGRDVSFTGPSLTDCTNANGPAGAWDTNTAFFNVSGGTQIWTVPVSGSYTISAAGAAGGNSGGYNTTGRGVTIQGTFTLTQGETLKILVGARGAGSIYDGAYSCDAGGGGGTFVTRSDNTPLIIAGGGGGNTHSGCSSTSNGADASFTTTPTGGGGGTSGGGGSRVNASGGAGLTGNGSTHYTSGSIPQSFSSGGTGGRGDTGTSSPYEEPFGGFGGGGGGHGQCHAGGGGGGGYNGGGHNGTNTSCGGGGGGGSFIMSGVTQSNGSYNSGAGSVTITRN